MTSLGRRNFLRLSGVAASSLVFPSCIRDALEVPASSCAGSLLDLEHVVILIQENRAFDHYFGTMRGVRGFGDRLTIPVAGAPTVWHQRDDAGVVLPYHLDQTAGNAQRVEGTPHGFIDAQLAYDHGRYGEWPSFKHRWSMGHYAEQELPFQFALAEAFTLCDAYFCSLHSGTNPNRLYAFTGTNDPLGAGGGPALTNSHDTLGDPEMGYTWRTYAERLEEAGVSWKLYQDMGDNFTDNPLVGFRSYREAELTDPSSALVTKALSTTLTDASLDALRSDVLTGGLPSVSWIVGPAAYSEHPGPSSPAQGAAYVRQVLEALTADPERWGKTALLVTFDENDGFFDHVPPPCPPSMRRDGTLMGASSVDDTEDRYERRMPILGGRPTGPGVRVPMWVVSPFSRGGWVCSENFDHTSILRFLERRFGVVEPNISDFRRAFCGDLCSAFDFVTPNEGLVPVLAGYTRETADALRVDQEALDQVPIPDEMSATLPTQAEGTRPSRALPYELDVELRASRDALSSTLTFDNRGTVGAVFHVYDRRDLVEIPRRYAVETRGSITDMLPWVGDGYDYEVFGPNGFYRRFAGDGSSAGLRVDSSYDGERETLSLLCRNDTDVAQEFTLVAQAYSDRTPLRVAVTSGRREEVTLDLSGSGRWYDYEVTVEAVASFRRRFAGRVENGLPSVSDPAFGSG